MKLPLIKAAAIVSLVQGAAHGALILLGKPRHGPSELLVVETMQHYVFNFGGIHRSYWDLYLGYALLAYFAQGRPSIHGMPVHGFTPCRSSAHEAGRA